MRVTRCTWRLGNVGGLWSVENDLGRAGEFDAQYICIVFLCESRCATAVCKVCVTISIFAKRVTQKGKIKMGKP